MASARNAPGGCKRRPDSPGGAAPARTLAPAPTGAPGAPGAPGAWMALANKD
jgi:hypothetical protein